MPVAAGIHDLLYVVQRGYGAGTAEMTGDDLLFWANIGGGLGKTAWYMRNQVEAWAKKLKEAPEGTTATYIVDYWMVLVGCVDFFNGFGTPSKGAGFDSTAALQPLFENLNDAKPDETKWSGTAEQAYAKQNDDLTNLVKLLRDLDKQTQGTVKDQGSAIDFAHRFLSLTLMGLIFAQGVALALWCIPGYGPAISWKFQWGVVAATGIGVGIVEGMTNDRSESNEDDAKVLVGQYQAVTANAQALLKQITGLTTAPKAENSTAVDVQAIPDSTSGGSSGMPPVASLSRLASQSASEDERSLLQAKIGLLQALTADGETPGDRVADETPSSASPTLARLSPIPGQAAKVSSTIRQGAAAAAEEATPEEAELAGAAGADDVEGAAAAYAAAGAERAPLGVAQAGPEQAQETRR